MAERTPPPTPPPGGPTDETLGGQGRGEAVFPSPPFALGRYAATALLGRGGYGAVYRAQDRALGRAVAVKLVPAEGDRTPDEGRLVARFNHPHIVTLYTIGRWEGFDFLVMELMEGGSLADHLRRGPLPVEAAVRCLLQATMGLESAHAGEVAHRDIKPSNLLLTEAGLLKLGDFGIAGGGPGSGIDLPARRLPGTFAYLSPEAFRPGEAGASLAEGIARDLYALGITAFELLKGHPPFRGEPAEIIAQHEGVRVDLESLRALGAPPQLRTLIRALLSKHPADRPRGAGEVRESLAGILARIEGEGVSHPPVPSRSRAPRRGESRVPGAPHPLHKIHARLQQDLGNLAGFFARLGGPTTVDEVYVEVCLQDKASRGKGLVEGMGWDPQRAVDEGAMRALHGGRPFKMREIIDLPHRRWVLLGDPGSGKTTLLHHLSMDLMAEVNAGDGARCPLFFRLSELETGWGLRRAVARFYGEDEVRPALDAAARGALVILLDGLDEAVDPVAARSAIAAICAEAPACQVIVTSRYTGYQEHPLAMPFETLTLRPLEEEQQQRLLKAWGIESARITTTLRHLHGRPRLKTIAETPLLLTLVALILRERPDATLPSRRGDLYRMALSQFLLRDFSPNHPGKEGKVRTLRSPEVAEEALGVIALELHGREGATYSGRDIRRALKGHAELFEDIKGIWGWKSDPEGIKTFLTEVAECTGIIEPETDNRGASKAWRFPHRTFREYLAAWALSQDITAKGLGEVPRDALMGAGRERRERKIAVAPGKLGEVLKFAVEQPGSWSEVLALTCGLETMAGGADLIVRWVALTGNPELVLRVVAEAENIREDTVWAVLGLEKGGDKWEQRKEVLEQLPALVLDGSAMIRLVDKFLSQTTNGSDLYFAREMLQKLAAGEVGVDSGLLLTEGDKAQASALARDVLKRHRPDAREKARAILEDQWIPIEGGSFMMGSEEITVEEKPVHRVSLSVYRLQIVPVTNVLYELFDPEHREGRRFTEQVKDPEELNRHPVVDVAWYEARMFAEWVGATLPTEAQWEFAARGPEGRRYPWGDGEPNDELGNFSHNVGHPTPVGSYPAGASWCGALDLAGNVWEWCRDLRGPYDPTQTDDPIGPPDGAVRVVRGGSWYVSTDWLRGAFRDGLRPGDRGYNVGFRLAAPPSPNSDDE